MSLGIDLVLKPTCSINKHPFGAALAPAPINLRPSAASLSGSLPPLKAAG